jgi:uncharacterized membrane protein
MVLLLAARLLHILLGVFWVGAIAFNTIFLGPAMAEAGPDGAKVMAGVIRRRFTEVMPVVALLTIASGLWLFWRISGGFDPHWMRTGVGHAYGAGGVLAIVGFVVGILTIRPTMKRVSQLATGAQQETDAAKRQAIMAEVAGLRRRATTMGWVVTILLVLATAAMAVARYI